MSNLKGAKLLFLFLLSFPLYADNGDWRKLNLKTLDHCFNFERFDKPEVINPALLSAVCFFTILTGRNYIHHHDFRPIRSRHHYGNALDFRVHSYADMNRRERLIQYRQDLQDLLKFLETFGLIDKVGLGIYPQSPHPFFHLDLRGKKGRWAIIDKEQLGWTVGIDWMETFIEDQGQAL